MPCRRPAPRCQKLRRLSAPWEILRDSLQQSCRHALLPRAPCLSYRVPSKTRAHSRTARLAKGSTVPGTKGFTHACGGGRQTQRARSWRAADHHGLVGHQGRTSTPAACSCRILRSTRSRSLHGGFRKMYSPFHGCANPSVGGVESRLHLLSAMPVSALAKGSRVKVDGASLMSRCRAPAVKVHSARRVIENRDGASAGFSSLLM